MSDCLHCDINELVQKHLDQNQTVDVADVAAKLAESLADLILSVPAEQQAALLADAIAQLGQSFLEKAGGADGETTH